MKIFAREVLWLFLAFLCAVPLAYGFVYLIKLIPESEVLTTDEEVFQMEFFFAGALLGFFGVYVMRVIMWAISTIVKKGINAT